jgi:hypothetical protein
LLNKKGIYKFSNPEKVEWKKLISKSWKS